MLTYGNGSHYSKTKKADKKADTVPLISWDSSASACINFNPPSALKNQVRHYPNVESFQ
jgi:hypothetical protein